MTNYKKKPSAKNNKQMSKVKIFVGYYKPNFVFQSDVYEPILTANIDWPEQPDILRDSIGINVAERSQYYGELSGHYWVWKNFLPNTKDEYIGFCHYRRFLDFGITPMPDVPFKPMFLDDFKNIFQHYTGSTILNCIKEYDIVLPHKFYFQQSLYEQYIKYHPKKEMDLALDVLKELYPDYSETAKQVMDSNELYICLNFIMKKELLNDYMEWIFSILTLVEERSNWSEYTDYLSIRVAAFLAERFFNIWLSHNIKTKGLNILKTSSIYLIGEDYSAVDPNIYILRYNVCEYLLRNNQLAYSN